MRFTDALAQLRTPEKHLNGVSTYGTLWLYYVAKNSAANWRRICRISSSDGLIVARKDGSEKAFKLDFIFDGFFVYPIMKIDENGVHYWWRDQKGGNSLQVIDFAKMLRFADRDEQRHYSVLPKTFFT